VTIRPALLRAVPAGLLVLGLSLTGCAGKAAAPADSSAASTTSSSAASSSTPASAGQRIEVTFADGRAEGDTGRVAVAVGTPVTLVVTSDVADQVHVHGYDIEQELTPGRPATLQFDATVTGVFEVELHEADTVLLRLQVS
jgi:hypothetical protein